jgi:hypothetical protein
MTRKNPLQQPGASGSHGYSRRMARARRSNFKGDDQYKRSRDVWEDSNHRQEFEHDLINRKTTWSLTGQTILFAAYGVTLRSDVADNGKHFREVVAYSGLLVAAATFVGLVFIIISKYLSWRQYRRFYTSKELPLPRPLNEKPHKWGVNTLSTIVTLVPEIGLPIVFFVAWLYLI